MSALFPEPTAAIAEFRSDRLTLLAASLLGDSYSPSDSYIQGQLAVAEADAQRRLRTFFAPTVVFAYEPTTAEIDALAGAPWHEESAYDYEPALWNVDDWGYLVLREAPVIELDSVTLAYPAPMQGFYSLPLEWCRLDKKAGHVRFVPTGTGLTAGPLSTFLLSSMTGGRNIPQMIQIRYVAGLQNATTDFPDLVDTVIKMASLRIVQDAFLPQSASISADGLSQSLSAAMQGYRDGIDAQIDALMSFIHGPRMVVC